MTFTLLSLGHTLILVVEVIKEEYAEDEDEGEDDARIPMPCPGCPRW